jgi:hypothetical protein
VKGAKKLKAERREERRTNSRKMRMDKSMKRLANFLERKYGQR